jgi:hypothetical protein
VIEKLTPVRRAAKRAGFAALVVLVFVAPPHPAAAAAAGAAAAAASWSPIGPPDGSFQVLPAPSDPATIYATAGNGGMWRSHDGGVTWSYAGALGNASLVAVAPDQPATVYASALFALWKSTDGAATWTQLTTTVASATIAPSRPLRFYGLTLTPGDPQAPERVERSDDGGVTWNQVGLLPAGVEASFLVVAPNDANRVYVFGIGGFAASADGGATWGQAFNPRFDGATPVALLVAPNAPSTLYLALPLATGESGTEVYRSDDAGVSWVAADTGLPRANLASVVVGGSGALYASFAIPFDADSTTTVFSSLDRGASWQQVASSLANVDLTADGGTPDRLFLTGGTGIEISQDQGKTWTAPTKPPSAAFVSQTQIGPAAGGSHLYATDAADFSSSTALWETADFDGGGWRSLAAVGVFTPALALDAQPGVLYAYPTANSPTFPALSHDDGATWQPLPSLPPEPASQPFAIATDPLLPGKLVALGCRSESTHGQFFCTDWGIAYSNTFGRGWRLLAHLPRFTSGDGLLVREVAGHPDMAYAAFGDSLFKTNPGGATPLLTLPLTGSVVDLIVLADAPAAAPVPTLYALVERPRIFWQSLDGGAHWAAASAGLPTGATPVALAYDPGASGASRPAALYLATEHQLFLSTDAAASWKPLPTAGLPTFFRITSLAVAPPPAHALLVGTGGAGIFTKPLP